MRPLILQYAVDRIEPKNVQPGYKPYNYNGKLSLNTILIHGREQPFIDSIHVDISLLTKTKVANEADDSNYDALQLRTKTEVRQESDDPRIEALILKTKTLTAVESDDEDIPRY